MAKHFLYLTNERLTCLIWQRSGFVEKRSFSAHNPSSHEFEKYLATHGRTPAYLVVDLTEEDFRVETIPHLRGSDQAAILARKLGQIYRNTPFRHAVIQGREEEGRRDDRVLYHGVTNPDLVRPWLAVLEKLHIPLEGIYSAPVLSGELLKSLDIFFPHTLLVSLVAGDGLRQTYFHNKQVKFSRLTPLEHGLDLSFGQQIAEETSRTWQYLDSLRYFTAEDTLEVCILLHPKDRKQVTDAIRDFPLLQHRILDTDEVSAKIQLKPPPATSHAEEVFVHLFASGNVANHFAVTEQTRNARLRRVGVGIHVINAAILATALAGAGVMFLQGRGIDSETRQRDIQTRQLVDRYRALTGQMLASQVSSDTSRDAAAFYNTYLSPTGAPATHLRAVSHVLARFPDIQLEQASWFAAEDEKAAMVVSAPSRTSSLPVKSESRKEGQGQGSTPPAVTIDNPAVQLPANRYHVLLLESSIGPFAGDYRELLERIQVFVDALGKIPGCKASLAVPPLDIRSAATLKANLSAKQGAAQDARFVVRIIRSSVVPESKS